MEMHDRIRELRKNHLHLSQTAFGERLGVSRSVINNIELNTLARPDQKRSLIKLMCKEFSVSEEWLLNGTEPMFIEPDTFSLDQYARERGASELELALAKAYFDLPKDVRTQMLARLKSLLNGEVETATELTPQPPSNDLDGLTTKELEAMYEEEQYKKEPPGVHKNWRRLSGVLSSASCPENWPGLGKKQAKVSLEV